jgi:hypothetical protein
MSGRDVSFYLKTTFLVIDVAALGLINYFLFLDNANVLAVLFVNTFTGIAPLAVVLPISMAKDYIILNQYGIESLKNKDVFKRKTKTIFDK